MSDMDYQRWRDSFHAALNPRFYPAAWLDEQVENGTFRCWSNDRAAVLAGIKAYPSGLREAHGMLAVGDLDAIKELIPLFEQWGRDIGCGIAVIESRLGWAKVLPDYKPHQLAILKEL